MLCFQAVASCVGRMRPSGARGSVQAWRRRVSARCSIERLRRGDAKHGQERAWLQLSVRLHGGGTLLVQLLAWTLTGEGRGVAQVDMPRGDARGAHWGSAGGLGFVGAPGACQGEREGCSDAETAVLVCFGQQREERAEMHPCGMSKRGR
jgi:hypothetical protein